MKSTARRAALVLSTITGIFAPAAFLAEGCGGDDTIIASPDGGGDSTAGDAPSDHSVAPDSGTDVAQPGDTGSDGLQPSDASEGGAPFDAGVDAPPIGDYLHQVAVAGCIAFRDCCGVAPAQWNEAQCESDSLPPNLGYPSGVNAYAGAFDGGRVAYDPWSAAKCIADLYAISKGSPSQCGVQTAQYLLGLKTECIGALKGIVPWDGGPDPADAGGACNYAIECLPGGYCAPSTDGGSKCAPIEPVGGPCTPGGRNEGCTYLGLGTPSDFCDTAADGSTTCQPSLGLDASCGITDQVCQSNLCFSHCAASGVFSFPNDPNSCGYYTLTPDAGGD
jgi:hypothetical protein